MKETQGTACGSFAAQRSGGGERCKLFSPGNRRAHMVGHYSPAHAQGFG